MISELIELLKVCARNDSEFVFSHRFAVTSKSKKQRLILEKCKFILSQSNGRLNMKIFHQYV